MQFEHPRILYALWVLLIPIVVHLFRLRPYKKVYFTHVDLLKDIELQTRKPSRIKERLLLFLRLLLMLCLILAFAKPYYPKQRVIQAIDEQKRVALYVDNSFSMTRQGKEGSLLDEAKNQALQIVEAAAADAQFLLLLNEPNIALQTWLYKSDVKKRIAEVQAVYQQKDISAIITTVRELMPQSAIHPLATYLISDFQQQEMLKNIAVLDTNIVLHLLPLQAQQIDNLSVDSLFLQTATPQQYQPMQLKVKVSNYSAQARSNLVMRLYVGEHQKAFKSFEVAAYDTAWVEMTFMVDSAAAYAAYVELDEESVSFDNRLYFSFIAQNKWKVGLMSEDKPNAYLTALFAAEKDVDLLLFKRKQAAYDQWQELDLLVLDELMACSSGMWSVIQSYLKQGGSILFLPPNNPSALQQWNTYFKTHRLPYYGAKNSSKTTVAEIDKKLPFFQEVFDDTKETAENIKKALPSIAQFYPIHLLGKDSRSLLQNKMGYSILSSSKVEGGSLYHMAFPLRMSFSKLPEYALFVPVIYQMLKQKEAVAPLYFTIGNLQNTYLQLPRQQVAEELKLVDAVSKNEWVADYNALTSVVHLASVPWQRAGAYALLRNDSVCRYIALNYSRSESDMASSPKPFIQRFLKQYPQQMQLIETSLKEKNKANFLNDNTDTELWYYLLLLVFGIIFIELLVAAFWSKFK